MTTFDVNLEDKEWQQIIQIVSNAMAPWVVTNPILMKITQQLHARQQQSVEPNSGRRVERMDRAASKDIKATPPS